MNTAKFLIEPDVLLAILILVSAIAVAIRTLVRWVAQDNRDRANARYDAYMAAKYPPTGMLPHELEELGFRQRWD